MHNNLLHRGFIKTFDTIVKSLVTPLDILPIASRNKSLCNKPFEVRTLWDTGASLTFIKPALRDKLDLRMFRVGSSMSIAGLGGLVQADFTILTILLANNFIIEQCPVYVVDFPVNYDMIIGTDIINMGDFAVSNTDNCTSFTFAIPPFPDRLNFAEKADIYNKNNL